MVFLPKVNQKEAIDILSRIREKNPGLPVSFGLAIVKNGKGIDEGIIEADLEMYKDKKKRKRN
jgi:PleD family two-component response regulator